MKKRKNILIYVLSRKYRILNQFRTLILMLRKFTIKNVNVFTKVKNLLQFVCVTASNVTETGRSLRQSMAEWIHGYVMETGHVTTTASGSINKTET